MCMQAPLRSREERPTVGHLPPAEKLHKEDVINPTTCAKKSKVLLLSLPGLSTGDEPIFPLGIGYLLASLQRDRTARAVHYQSPQHAQDQIPELVGKYAPDIVGLTCTTFNRGIVTEVCRWLRTAHPEVRIVVGGVHVSFMHEQALRVMRADCVVIGEGEETFRELCRAWDEKLPLHDVKGIAFLDGDRVVKTPARLAIQDLDELPMPDYSFAGDLMRKSGMGFVISSRGCPVQCCFCSTGSYWGQKVRVNSPRRVVDEMEALVANYGVKRIFFHDDTFNLGTARVRQICDEIKARGLDVEWGVSCRVHPVSEEMIDAMVEAGCRHICWGIESGSKEMLQRIDKKITQEQIKNAFDLCRKHLGTISVGAFTMVGNPGETEATVEESARFIDTLQLTDPPSTAILYILPGTKLYAGLLEKHPDIERYWVESFDIMHYTMENTQGELREWGARIARSGTIVPMDRTRHFWNNVLFGEVPKPAPPRIGSVVSELDQVIPPEIQGDEFYFLIRQLAAGEKIRSVLEIGSSAGGGSTEAFVTGLEQNPDPPALYCMEVSQPRFQELQQRYRDKGFVRCYNTSSVSLARFPDEGEVAAFYHSQRTALNGYPLERVLGWLQQDIDYVRRTGVDEDGIARIRRENGIDLFDMVLIDGSEFTGKPELDQVYGARWILLDDVNGFKNFENYQRLRQDPAYRLYRENWQVRNGYAVFKKKEDELPVHFFTIVLNGEPFIRHHIEEFAKLPFDWHWHVIEGVAELAHDTAWSVQNGGRITPELHRGGVSNDGTSQYLDRLQAKFPERISIYRKQGGAFWDGKLEMVSAPLENIGEECLLWQVDADELWSAEQIGTARDLFLREPEKTAAFYYCNFYVGPELVISTRDTYGNHSSYEWLRTWRYLPGDRWASHEPPRLCRQEPGGSWQDLAALKPLLHHETEGMGLVFEHMAYVSEQQLRFKEIYYGYADAVAGWRHLQEVRSFPVRLGEYFPWVNDGALVRRKGDAAAGVELDGSIGKIIFLRPDSIGDNVLAAAMLPHIKERFPGASITVLCQRHIAELYEASPLVDAVIGFDRVKAYENELYRDLILKQLQQVGADLLLNSLYSREPLYDLFAIGSGARTRIAFNGDFCNIPREIRDENNRYYTAIIADNPAPRPELERHREFLAALGISAPPLAPLVWTTQEDEQSAQEFFASKGLDPEKTLALFACGQWGEKIYPHYGAALRDICAREGFSIIALGTARDAEVNRTILEQIGATGFNLAGGTTIRQSAAILRRCRLAFGADTGTAHLASAVGTRNVVLLGGGHFGRFQPYSATSSIVALPLACYQCNWSCRYSQTHCIKSIAPEVVAVAFMEALAGGSSKPRVYLQGESTWHPLPGEPQWGDCSHYLDAERVEVRVVERNTENGAGRMTRRFHAAAPGGCREATAS